MGFPFFRTNTSPTLYVYGYEIGEVEAIKYLVEKDPEWAKIYSLFGNHVKALETIAEELSEKCDLALHALPLYVGGHHMSYGMVFFGDEMSPRGRTQTNTDKLKKLEGLLESMGIVKTEKAKLEVLCSAAHRAYPVESPSMAKRPPPPGSERDRGHELLCLMEESAERYPRSEQVKSGKRPIAEQVLPGPSRHQVKVRTFELESRRGNTKMTAASRREERPRRKFRR